MHTACPMIRMLYTPLACRARHIGKAYHRHTCTSYPNTSSTQACFYQPYTLHQTAPKNLPFVVLCLIQNFSLSECSQRAAQNRTQTFFGSLEKGKCRPQCKARGKHASHPECATNNLHVRRHAANSCRSSKLDTLLANGQCKCSFDSSQTLQSCVASSHHRSLQRMFRMHCADQFSNTGEMEHTFL